MIYFLFMFFIYLFIDFFFNFLFIITFIYLIIDIIQCHLYDYIVFCSTRRETDFLAFKLSCNYY